MKKQKPLVNKCSLMSITRMPLMVTAKIKIKSSYLIILLLIIGSFHLKSQAISNLYFGINGWMPANVFTLNLNGHVKSSELCITPPNNIVGQLGTKIMRYGGTAMDYNLPTIPQYTTFIQMARDNNMEPLIQILFFTRLRQLTIHR
jgi:hypothetical protein